MWGPLQSTAQDQKLLAFLKFIAILSTQEINIDQTKVKVIKSSGIINPGALSDTMSICALLCKFQAKSFLGTSVNLSIMTTRLAF